MVVQKKTKKTPQRSDLIITVAGNVSFLVFQSHTFLFADLSVSVPITPSTL